MLAGACVPVLLLAVGWQSTLLAVALANLLCIAVVMPLRARLDADVGLPNFVQPLRLVLRAPRLRRLALVPLLFCAIQLSLTTYLVAYLHAELGHGLMAAGFALSVAQACGAGGRIVWGRVADE